jgi:hypothetical protein
MLKILSEKLPENIGGQQQLLALAYKTLSTDDPIERIT